MHAAPGIGMVLSFPGWSNAGRIDFLVNAGDLERSELEVAARFSQREGFQVEGEYAFRTRQEEFYFRARSEDEKWNSLGGGYDGETHFTHLVLRNNFGFGPVTLKGGFEWSSPVTPQGEYGLTDSSRILNFGLLYGDEKESTSPTLWLDFQESAVHTQGLRIQPESQGRKRFHYAFNHGYRVDAGWRSAVWNWAAQANSRWGLLAGYGRFNSAPDESAFAERKESLSYNRLGLSYIADVWGGFYQSAEFMEVSLRMPMVGLETRHVLHLDGLHLSFDLPIYFSHIDLEFYNETRTQLIFAVRREREFSYGLTGFIAVATPRLGISFRHHGLTLSARVAQTLPVWDNLENGGSDKGQSDPGKAVGGKFPFGANGLLAEIAFGYEF